FNPPHGDVKMRLVRHRRSLKRPGGRFRLEGKAIEGLSLTPQIEPHDPALVLQRLTLKAAFRRAGDWRADAGKKIVPTHREGISGNAQMASQSFVSIANLRRPFLLRLGLLFGISFQGRMA